jgi:hypothetical protein
MRREIERQPPADRGLLLLVLGVEVYLAQAKRSCVGRTCTTQEAGSETKPKVPWTALKGSCAAMLLLTFLLLQWGVSERGAGRGATAPQLGHATKICP